MIYLPNMTALKNIRHEHFVREYIANGGNGADAYRKVNRRFPWKSTGMNNEGGYKVVACVIRQRPDVQRREQELRAKMQKKADITLEKILTDYQEALDLAKEQAKPNDIVNAATAQAKLVGLLRDRVEHGEAGDFDEMESAADILAAVGERVSPEAALALAKAFGLDESDKRTSDAPNEKGTGGLMNRPPPSDAVN